MSRKACRYRLWCNTDSKYEYVWAEDIDTAPSLCPTNTAHIIDGTKTTIVSNIDEAKINSEPVLPVGGPKVMNVGWKFTATKNTSTVFDYKFTEDVHIKDGFFQVTDHVPGDYTSMHLIDKDGIVYPAGTVMHKYITNYPLKSSGLTETINAAITEDSMNGFWIRTTYVSVGTVTDPLIEIGINGYLI